MQREDDTEIGGRTSIDYREEHWSDCNCKGRRGRFRTAWPLSEWRVCLVLEYTGIYQCVAPDLTCTLWGEARERGWRCVSVRPSIFLQVLISTLAVSSACSCQVNQFFNFFLLLPCLAWREERKHPTLLDRIPWSCKTIVKELLTGLSIACNCPTKHRPLGTRGILEKADFLVFVVWLRLRANHPVGFTLGAVRWPHHPGCVDHTHVDVDEIMGQGGPKRTKRTKKR